MNMKIFSSVLIAAALIGFAFLITKGPSSPTINGNNVSIVGDKQIVDLTAGGGYTPESSTAKANIHTVLRFKTSGTFDCSSYVRIPSLNIGQSLASEGVTEIDLGTPKEGVLRGSCGMGMYPFEILFE